MQITRNKIYLKPIVVMLQVQKLKWCNYIPFLSIRVSSISINAKPLTCHLYSWMENLQHMHHYLNFCRCFQICPCQTNNILGLCKYFQCSKLLHQYDNQQSLTFVRLQIQHKKIVVSGFPPCQWILAFLLTISLILK